eukprot:g920.t1
MIITSASILQQQLLSAASHGSQHGSQHGVLSATKGNQSLVPNSFSLFQEEDEKSYPTSFDSFHDDIVHDLCHDFYGQRLATCSSDKTIKIFDKVGKSSSPGSSSSSPSSSLPWQLVADWRAHQGAVWRVDWAHPEYGTILASCSFDRTVCIWEETLSSPVALEKLAPPMPQLQHFPSTNIGSNVQPSFTPQQSNRNNTASNGTTPTNTKNNTNHSVHSYPQSTTTASNSTTTTSGTSGISRWVLRSQLLDSRDSVNAVKFAPKHHGLKLAAASEDGCIRVYVAQDAMNPEFWQIEEEFEVTSLGPSTTGTQFGISSLDWHKGRAYGLPPLLVIGTNSGQVVVWMRHEKQRRWFALLQLETNHEYLPQSNMPLTSAFKKSKTPITSKDTGIDTVNDTNGHHPSSAIPEPSSAIPEPSRRLKNCAVHDVAWAPSLGRSFEQITAATHWGEVLIWRIDRKRLLQAVQTRLEANDVSSLKKNTTHVAKPVLKIHPMATLKDHGASVWRVRWNVTGTVLASSGDDGSVRMWKCSFQDQWQCVSIVQGTA